MENTCIVTSLFRVVLFNRAKDLNMNKTSLQTSESSASKEPTAIRHKIRPSKNVSLSFHCVFLRNELSLIRTCW